MSFLYQQYEDTLRENQRLEATNADLLEALEPILAAYKAEVYAIWQALGCAEHDPKVKAWKTKCDERIDAAEAAIAKARKP